MRTGSSVHGPDWAALGSPHLEGRPCPARPPSEPDAGTTVLLTGPPTETHPQGPGVGGSTSQAYRGSPLHFLIHRNPVIHSLHHNTHPSPSPHVPVWEFLSKEYLLRNALLRASSTFLVELNSLPRGGPSVSCPPSARWLPARFPIRPSPRPAEWLPVSICIFPSPGRPHTQGFCGGSGLLPLRKSSACLAGFALCVNCFVTHMDLRGGWHAF